jgi:cytochrome c oxidase cbb3-type subunit 4
VDVNTLRIVVTLVSFVAFLGIVRWALARKNAAAFDEAAQLPFLDGDQAADKDGKS